MRIPESELIINGDGSVFHIHLKPEELADNVIPNCWRTLNSGTPPASSSPLPAAVTASASPSFPMASAPTTSIS